MTHKYFTKVERDISRDYIWTADVFPTEAAYPFNIYGDYTPTLRDSGLYLNMNMGTSHYYRIIPEATSNAGMTVKFEARTNNNPTNYARVNCHITTGSSIGSESSSLCSAVTRDGIYDWAGSINPSNYYLVNCLVFNSFLWQMSESGRRSFINDQTFSTIVASHTAVWSDRFAFGDGTGVLRLIVPLQNGDSWVQGLKFGIGTTFNINRGYEQI